VCVCVCVCVCVVDTWRCLRKTSSWGTLQYSVCLSVCVCGRHLALSEEDEQLRHIADIAQVLKQVYNTLTNAASMLIHVQWSTLVACVTVFTLGLNVLNFCCPSNYIGLLQSVHSLEGWPSFASLASTSCENITKSFRGSIHLSPWQLHRWQVFIKCLQRIVNVHWLFHRRLFVSVFC